MQTTMTTETYLRIIELLEMGLFTDGSRHKQWCLYEIAKLMGCAPDKDELWEEPIAP